VELLEARLEETWNWKPGSSQNIIGIIGFICFISLIFIYLLCILFYIYMYVYRVYRFYWVFPTFWPLEIIAFKIREHVQENWK
jgi:hypothetical protein